jgi:hypothetical protein
MGAVSLSLSLSESTADAGFLWGRIETKVGLWRKGTESEGWLEGADWVVDAIDNINTKVRRSGFQIDGR